MNDRVYEIAKNCKYDGYERALVNMVYISFNKKQDQEWVWMNN